MTIKPATPLPWSLPTHAAPAQFLAAGNCIPVRPAKDAGSSDTLPVLHVQGFAMNRAASERNAAYIVHAANAYPRNITAARELLAALDREHAGQLGVDTAAAANRLSALLAKLGEE